MKVKGLRRERERELGINFFSSLFLFFLFPSLCFSGLFQEGWNDTLCRYLGL